MNSSNLSRLNSSLIVEKHTKRYYGLILLWGLLLIMFSSCTFGADNRLSPEHVDSFPSPTITSLSDLTLHQIGDGGILSDEPCGPPCFWNITPGKSNYVDVIRILADRGILSYCDLRKNGLIANCIKNDEGDYALQFGCNDGGVVVDIVFRPPVLITVGDIISIFGIPNKIWFQTEDYIDYYESSSILNYDDIQTTFILPYQENYQYDLQSTTKIDAILLSDANAYQEYYQSLGVENWVDWRGFGQYEDPN